MIIDIARNLSSVAFRLFAFLFPAFVFMGCPRSTSSAKDAGTEGSAQTTLLGAIAGCATTTAQELQAAAGALASQTEALAASPEMGTRLAAREAFRSTMAAWQRTEPMQFGPAASSSLPGGQDLRDYIYSWPLLSRCAVEEALVAGTYENGGISKALVNRRGLAALEYLLFYEGTDTACTASSPIVSSGSWAALSPAEKDLRRRKYAAAAAADVLVKAKALADAWGGDFGSVLQSAGPGNSTYPTTQAALNAVSDALFYLEKDVKDAKLARPLGLRDCETETCPEQLESHFAALSKANIRANLEGGRRLLQGCEAGYAGAGFDDLLTHLDAAPVAEKLTAGLTAAEAALGAIEEADLAQALNDDAPSVRALYDRLKAVTDVLKTEFVTVLDLELPSSLEGDND